MDGKLFLDLHVIQTLPPSCVNRDDTGSPKTAFYGGVRRARVSSQSWKRAMRQSFKESFGDNVGIRTLRVVDLIANKIVEKNPSLDIDEAQSMAGKLLETYGIKLKENKTKKSKESDSKISGALMFITSKHTELLADLILSEEYGSMDPKTLKAAVKDIMMSNNSPDIILFGRMLADDPSLNVDASCQIAHAISTHKVENEYDYFTAMDDLSPEDTAGAGMIGTVEFNSSTLYRYATLAVHELAAGYVESNEIILDTIREYIRSFVLSMPTGKQNTFANRTVPDAVFISIRKDQPVNLVGAFEIPVAAKQTEGFALPSAKKMAEYENKICADFVNPPEKTWQIGSGLEDLGPSTSLKEAIEDVIATISPEL